MQRCSRACVASFLLGNVSGPHGTLQRLRYLGTARRLEGMDGSKPESQFVRLIMAGANEAEIEEATRYWFAYLRLLDTLANEFDRPDSQMNDPYVRFEDDSPPDV